MILFLIHSDKISSSDITCLFVSIGNTSTSFSSKFSHHLGDHVVHISHHIPAPKCSPFSFPFILLGTKNCSIREPFWDHSRDYNDILCFHIVFQKLGRPFSKRKKVRSAASLMTSVSDCSGSVSKKILCKFRIIQR